MFYGLNMYWSDPVELWSAPQARAGPSIRIITRSPSGLYRDRSRLMRSIQSHFNVHAEFGARCVPPSVRSSKDVRRSSESIHNESGAVIRRADDRQLLTKFHSSVADWISSCEFNYMKLEYCWRIVARRRRNKRCQVNVLLIFIWNENLTSIQQNAGSKAWNTRCAKPAWKQNETMDRTNVATKLAVHIIHK